MGGKIQKGKIINFEAYQNHGGRPPRRGCVMKLTEALLRWPGNLVDRAITHVLLSSFNNHSPFEKPKKKK